MRLHPFAKILQIESNGLVAIEKPKGVLCTPAPRLEGVSAAGMKLIVDAAYDEEQECYRMDGSDRLYLLHRLDAGTSGVLLFSASKQTALEVKTLFKKRMVSKDYRALCFSLPGAASWLGLQNSGELWHDELQLRDRTVQAETALVQGSHCTKTSTALLTLRPTTGFTHQLRVQCARRRLPIVGDSKHGDWTMNRGWKGAKRLYLHAENISFSLRQEDPGDKSLYKFVSPLPEEFHTTVQ